MCVLLFTIAPNFAQEAEGTSQAIQINLKRPEPKPVIKPEPEPVQSSSFDVPVPAEMELANAHRYYALIMAVNDYVDPNITPLDEPINDATKFKDVLVTNYTFEEENIRFLKNPTYADMVIAFDKLSKEIRPSDFLLVFYAGHGYYNDQTEIGYWLPSDAARDNTVQWFRNSALVENMGAIDSKHTLLISDACFSGGIFKTRAAFNNANANIADMLQRPSRKAITSGALTTVPDKSVFMQYLLKILEENNDKYLPTEVLFYELALRMKYNSDTRPLYGEIKNVGDEGGNFVFIKRD